MLQVVTVVYTFFSVFASLFLMPLRALHPLLRRLGLKNHFLPIDIVQKHYSRGFLYLCGVTVRWEGIEHLVSTAQHVTHCQHGYWLLCVSWLLIV